MPLVKPGAQGWHVHEVVLAKVPGEQREQEALLLVETLPAMQAVQDEAATPLLVPAGQGVHN